MRLLVVIFLLAACGATDDPASDAGREDARFLADARVLSCSAEMDTCAESSDFARLCDTSRGRCVECLEAEDCAADDAFGPACDVEAGACRCDADEACQGNANGTSCHPIARSCSCIDASNCGEGEACELEPYLGAGVRTCRPAPT